MKTIDVEKAVSIFRQGGIVIYPTDTTFGVGCRIDASESISRLFEIRKRPQTQATPVLVSSIEMAKKYLTPLSSRVKNLMIKYWPGGLTIVYPCMIKAVPLLARGGGLTLGVRMPNNIQTLHMIEEVGVPILGPSANFHEEPTPFSISNLDPQLVQLVDGVVDGTCKTKMPSTVIDCSKDEWKILRQGSVHVQILYEKLPHN